MNDYVVIDTETSGLDENTDEIIRLSALRIENGEISDRFSSFCKPIKPLTGLAERLTGITNEVLTNQPPIAEILPRFLRFVGEFDVVAHNVGFDMKFINGALEKANMSPLENKAVDTFEIARNKLLLQKYTLRHIAEFLSVGGNCDEEIVFAVYEKLKDMPERMLTANEMSYLEDLWKNANRRGLSDYVRQRCFRAYFDELGKVPPEDIETLHGEELEKFNLAMALDWVNIQGGDGNEQEKISEKYEQYLNGLSQEDREYDVKVARTLGNGKSLGEDGEGFCYDFKRRNYKKID